MRGTLLRPLSRVSFALGALSFAGIVIAVVYVRAAAPGDGWLELPRRGIVALLVLSLISLLAAGWLARAAHRARRDTAMDLLSSEESERVVAAIRAFEHRTSGEIRVHVDYESDRDPMARAGAVFAEFGMTETRERNGVLFYVAAFDRRLAVVGDTGIDAVTDESFWSRVVAKVERAFADGRPADGLIAGIEMAGAALAEHFPPRDDDVDELPDAISTGPHPGEHDDADGDEDGEDGDEDRDRDGRT